MMKKTKYLLPLLGLGLFFIIIFFVINPVLLIKTISGIKIVYFIPIFLLCFPLVGFKAWRWQLFLKKQNIHYSFLESFSMYAVGIFLSLLTPGKLGEAAKIFYLRQDNYSVRISLVTIILDRLADLFFLIVLLLIGFLLFYNYFAIQVFYVIFLIIITLLILFWFISNKIYLQMIKFIIPQKYQNILSQHSQNFFSDFKKYNSYDYFIGLLLTAAAWLIYIIQIDLLALSLDLKLNFLFLLPMIAVANAADLLPISFNGLGTREATFIFFFSLIALPAEKATALGIMQLFIVLSISIIGFIYWLKKPINFKLIQ